jgi:hypothetical protein
VSHLCIVLLSVTRKLHIVDLPRMGTFLIWTGKLHLVDLAGSESLTHIPAAQHSGMQTAETRAINASLTALCDVLQAISRNARRAPGAPTVPVPYRIA